MVPRGLPVPALQAAPRLHEHLTSLRGDPFQHGGARRAREHLHVLAQHGRRRLQPAQDHRTPQALRAVHLAVRARGRLGGGHAARDRVEHALIAGVAGLPRAQPGLVHGPARVQRGRFRMHLSRGCRGPGEGHERGQTRDLRREPQELRHTRRRRQRAAHPGSASLGHPCRPRTPDRGARARDRVTPARSTRARLRWPIVCRDRNAHCRTAEV